MIARSRRAFRPTVYDRKLARRARRLAAAVFEICIGRPDHSRLVDRMIERMTAFINARYRRAVANDDRDMAATLYYTKTRWEAAVRGRALRGTLAEDAAGYRIVVDFVRAAACRAEEGARLLRVAAVAGVEPCREIRRAARCMDVYNVAIAEMLAEIERCIRQADRGVSNE